MFTKLLQTSIDTATAAAEQIQKQALVNFDTFVMQPLQKIEAGEFATLQKTFLEQCSKFSPADAMAKATEFYSQFVPATK